MDLDWTKKEFETYVLLYAAHSNFIEADEERDYILSKIDEQTFNRVHTEIVIDNKAENLDKIKQYLIENNYTQQEKEALIKDVKNVFFADGSVDLLEKKVFEILKTILK